MFTHPNENDAQDRLAHMLSEMHNDSAPIGWERYRSLASLLMMKLPIKHMVMDERFLDHEFQPGKQLNLNSPGVLGDPNSKQREGVVDHLLATLKMRLIATDILTISMENEITESAGDAGFVQYASTGGFTLTVSAVGSGGT